MSASRARLAKCTLGFVLCVVASQTRGAEGKRCHSNGKGGAVCGPVGEGKWVHYPIKDAMTDASSVVFELASENRLSTDLTRPLAKVFVYCDGQGHFSRAIFGSAMSLEVPTVYENYLPMPSSWVRFRIDTGNKAKLSSMVWGHVNPTTLAVGNRGDESWIIKGFLEADSFRIEFGTAEGNTEVAVFDPTGLDSTRMKEVCGMNWKFR